MTGSRFQAASDEIVRFHAALVDWFTGTSPITRFDAEFADVIHPQFTWVSPTGAEVAGAGLLDGLQAGHGTNPDFRIAVDDIRPVLETAGIVVATYVERQSGARNAPPANVRRSTVIFACESRLLWRHLHETYI